jgi:hypothetical protein
MATLNPFACCGSLCNNKCDTCAPNCTDFCNSDCCKKETTILIGYPSADHLKDLTPIFVNNSPDSLCRDVQKLNGSPIKCAEIQVKDVQEHLNGIRLRILAFTRKWLEELKEETEGDDEAWVRFVHGCKSRGIEIESKYKTGEPLTREQEKKAEQGLLQVNQYGSRACHLWRLVKINDCKNLEKLNEIQEISRKELDCLAKHLQSDQDFLKNALKADRFSKVPLGVQNRFIEAAKKAGKQQHSIFCKWSEAPDFKEKKERDSPDLRRDVNFSFSRDEVEKKDLNE